MDALYPTLKDYHVTIVNPDRFDRFDHFVEFGRGRGVPMTFVQKAYGQMAVTEGVTYDLIVSMDCMIGYDMMEESNPFAPLRYLDLHTRS